MQEQATAWEDIIAAKKEAVGLQLEGEYRSRLAAAHAAVKKRLDYQVMTKKDRPFIELNHSLTIRWRPRMCCDAWSRSTWLTGSLAT